MKLTTEHVNQMNSEAIINKISNLAVVDYDTVSELLPKLITANQLTLNLSIYTPEDPKSVYGVGRYLVYDHPDKKNPFSIWVFAFAPRQTTPIHNHKYKGTVIVLDEPISEKYYLPTGKSSARLIGCVDRYKFHTNRDDLDGIFVHQLDRREGLGFGTSVTLHIYNMEAHLINQEGEKIDRRNLDQIYFNDQAIDSTSPLPYEEEHRDELPII